MPQDKVRRPGASVNLVVFLRARLADLTAEQGKALSDLTLAENQRQARPGQARPGHGRGEGQLRRLPEFATDRHRSRSATPPLRQGS